jgi:ferredoxin-NADP reductase
MSDQIFHTQLLHREEVASGTIAFYMAKPADFHYKAGQSIDLTIPNPAETDAEGNTRAYSIASAPHEPELVIATRMRDTAFKRTLAKMPLGSELAIAGPFGSFNLPSNPGASCVFLIGGIGITPVRAMLLDATNAKRTNPLYLFYSNRTPSDAAFLTELRDLSNKHPLLEYHED